MTAPHLSVESWKSHLSQYAVADCAIGHVLPTPHPTIFILYSIISSKAYEHINRGSAFIWTFYVIAINIKSKNGVHKILIHKIII